MTLNPTILLIIAFAPLVGAIVAGLFRNRRSIDVADIDTLKG